MKSNNKSLHVNILLKVYFQLQNLFIFLSPSEDKCVYYENLGKAMLKEDHSYSQARGKNVVMMARQQIEFWWKFINRDQLSVITRSRTLKRALSASDLGFYQTKPSHQEPHNLNTACCLLNSSLTSWTDLLAGYILYDNC